MAKGKTIEEVQQEKIDRIMNVIAERAAFYRSNPQRFPELLGIHLKWFQKILLWAMNFYYYVIYMASRGQGKTFLTAIFLITRCILFPGTKVVICSGTLSQANEPLNKIKDDLYPKSELLRLEIKEMHVGQKDSEIIFKNGSWIKTKTSSSTARSARANILFVDESRMVDKTILDTVLRKFLTDSRHPRYLDLPEYKNREDLKERNHEIYCTSAWFKDHWSFEKAQAYVINFFDETKRYFVCALPYQLPIREGLLMRSQVEDEMSEADFSETAWEMEMECMWIGDGDGSFFKLNALNQARQIENVLLPLQFYSTDHPVPDPPKDGKRVLSLDIALMASTSKKKNDASAFFINDLEKTSNVSYKGNIVYGETFEGLTTDQLGLIAMRYFYQYKCTDFVIDTNGVGLGVYDYVIKPHSDPKMGEEYQAMTCINDDSMAIRCKEPDAKKVIWSVKANSKFNSQICIALRDAIANGRMFLPKNEIVVAEYLGKHFKFYKKSTPTEQVKIKTAFIQTTMAIYELIKLQTIVTDNGVTVKEKAGMRKDRYSSLAYSNWCMQQLQMALKPRRKGKRSLAHKLTIRRGSYLGHTI